MRLVKNILLILILTFSFIGNINCENHNKEEGGTKMVFPDKEWKRGNPEDFGFTQETLNLIDEKMRAASADGVLIRNGYLIAEWNYAGPAYTNVREGVQSCTKSITSMMLGLAIQDGLLPNVDAKVKEYWPDFETGPYTDKITFKHLVTMTSGMATVRNWGLEYFNPGNICPGKEYHYHNDQPVALAKALTYLYNRSLEDVLKEKILIHLQTDMKWGLDGKIKVSNGNEVPLVHGLGASQWTAEGLARVGHLYLNNGRWKDKQLFDESYIKESLTDIPFKINIWRAGKWQQQQPQTEQGLSKTGYGFGWWTDRGRDVKVWAMGGHGGQFCLVMPEYGVVMTKVNDWRKKPFISRGAFIPILLEVLKVQEEK